MRNYERRDHSRGPVEGVFTAAEKRRKRQQELQADAEREYNLDQERKRRAAYKAEYDKVKGTGNAQGGGSKRGAATDNENTKDKLRREFYRGN